MNHNTLFILALILFDGVAVGFGVWQYWTVRPTKTKTDEASALARASRKDPGHPEGEHRPDHR
jgi:hypothetical protein